MNNNKNYANVEKTVLLYKLGSNCITATDKLMLNLTTSFWLKPTTDNNFQYHSFM